MTSITMDKTKKRERNANFSIEETEKLIHLAEAYKYTIENKKSDAGTWQEKEKAWKAIAVKFNSSQDDRFRSAKHLKLKYEALKRDTRKKIRAASSLKEPRLSRIEVKVRDMMLWSVEGGESSYDSDPQETNGDQVECLLLSEANDESIDLETPMIDPDTVSGSTPLKRHFDQTNDMVPSSSKDGDSEVLETPQNKWADYRPSSETGESPDVCKTREKRPFDELVEGKLELFKLQKRLIEEELEVKMLKKQMIANEMFHKNELYKLEMEQMLLKTEILKADLESKRKS